MPTFTPPLHRLGAPCSATRRPDGAQRRRRTPSGPSARGRAGPVFGACGVGVLLFTGACAGVGLHARQLEDGTLQLECDGSLAECVRRAEDFCGDARIRLLGGEIRDGAIGNGGALTAGTVATVHFACTAGPRIAPHLGRRRRPPPTVAPAPPTPAPPVAPSAAVPPPSVCVPGATQVCVGPAACNGGQSCLPDGTGFGPCECAPVTP